jgi:hypothetical protein
MLEDMLDDGGSLRIVREYVPTIVCRTITGGGGGGGRLHINSMLLDDTT